MPAKQRLRRDEEGCPAIARQDAARGGEQHAVPPAKARPTHLAAEHLQLVAQKEDLDVLRLLVRAEGNERLGSTGT